MKNYKVEVTLPIVTDARIEAFMHAASRRFPYAEWTTLLNQNTEIPIVGPIQWCSESDLPESLQGNVDISEIHEAIFGGWADTKSPT